MEAACSERSSYGKPLQHYRQPKCLGYATDRLNHSTQVDAYGERLRELGSCLPRAPNDLVQSEIPDNESTLGQSRQLLI